VLNNFNLRGISLLKDSFPFSNKSLWAVVALSLAPLPLLVFFNSNNQQTTFLNLPRVFYTSFWTVFCIAVAGLTTMLAYADFKIRKNVSIILFGITAFVSSLLDFSYLYHIQKVNLSGPNAATSYFIWSLNGFFYALSLLLITLIFVKVKIKTLRVPALKNKVITKSFVAIALLGAVILFLSQIITNHYVNFEKTTPYISSASLIMALIWGLGYSKTLKLKLPNVFLKFLVLSAIPLTFSQILLLASQTAFDTYFNAANYLKFISYIIPSTGIIINYIDTLINEQKVISKLDVEIKEKKKLTNYLLEREGLLTNAEKISKLGSWVYDVKNKTTTWSNQLYKLYGFSDTSFTPTTDILRTLVVPESWDKFCKEQDNALLNKTNFAVEYQIKLPNGTTRFLLGQGYFSTKDNKLLGTVQDITELKEATLKLRKNETLLREGEAVAHNGSWEWHSDSEIMFWSDEMFNIHGHLPHSTIVTIKTYLDFVHPEDVELLAKTFFEAQKHKESFHISYRILQPSGDIRHVTTSGKYKRDELSGHFSFLGNTQDVTLLKETERKLEEKIAELNASNKDLEQFAYVASHDLQEPLRKIRAFGDRLVNKYADAIPSEGQDYIQRMQNASERMQILIDDLLAFSRVSRQPKVFEKVILSEAIEKVIGELEYVIEQTNAKITISVDETIEGLETQIFQVFQNIISNSLKFVQSGVEPIISITSKKILGNKLPINGAIASQLYCLINITDNGIGFDEVYTSKIFDLFQRLHARTEYKGTGIGLAICKKIIDSHSGFIFAKSKEGQGSSFLIALPINQA
jgi:signal transduction histidine kinase